LGHERRHARLRQALRIEAWYERQDAERQSGWRVCVHPRLCAVGQGIEAEATKYIENHGGKVLGSSKHPLNTSDFASLLLQAQGSKAKVIGLANAGGDTVNAVKQAAEFGIQQGGQSVVAFLVFVNDVHGMGLKVAQGLARSGRLPTEGARS
jgi:ABC-type branched-subunit amino acid transport system substrate-binding protein